MAIAHLSAVRWLVFVLGLNLDLAAAQRCFDVWLEPSHDSIDIWAERMDMDLSSVDADVI